MSGVSMSTLMIDPMNVMGQVNLPQGLQRNLCIPPTRPYCVIQDELKCFSPNSQCVSHDILQAFRNLKATENSNALCTLRSYYLDFTVICSGLVKFLSQFEFDFCGFESADGLECNDIALHGNDGCRLGHTANLTRGKAHA